MSKSKFEAKQMEYKMGKRFENIGYKATVTDDEGNVLGEFNSFVLVGDTEKSHEVFGATDLFGVFMTIERLRATFTKALETAPAHVQADLAARMLAYLMLQESNPEPEEVHTTGPKH